MWRGFGLILLCLVTFLLGIGRPAIQDADEAYYAEAGREMLVSGDWTTPHYNFETRIQKPILYYWLVAATYRVTGVNEWAARVWSGLAGLGLAMLAMGVARRWCGPAEGWLAGAIVATSFGVVPLARQALPDMPLAFFVTITIWAAIEACSVEARGARAGSAPVTLSRETWFYLAAVAAALGMLTKGPVALAVPATVVGPLIWWEWRRHRADGYAFPVRFRYLVVAAGLFVVVAAPWYVAVMQALGPDYARQFFIGENVERFATATYNEWRGWFYLPVIVAGLLPWSAFALLWFRPCREWVRGRNPVAPLDARLLAWALGPLTFFMVSVGSQPRYILPCVVPLAVLLARSICAEAGDQATARPRGRFLVSVTAAGALITLVGALVWRSTEILALPGDGAVTGPILMTVAGAMGTVLLVFSPRRWSPAVIVLSAACSLTVFQLSVLSPDRPEPVERLAAAVRAEGSGIPFCACGVMARSLVFYTRRPVVMAEVTPEYIIEARHFLQRPERVLAVVDARVLSRLEDAIGSRLPRVAEANYVSTGIWQQGTTLYSPDPGLVQRVVLVTNR